MSYQPGQVDAYYHRYAYDGENRLTEVYSGRDSVMLFLFPERDAQYNYYKHGPLARTELGQLRVQGVDYAYTLQGWLKGVNPAMGGTLTNGTDTTEGIPVAQDVYGFSLHYYKNDYKAAGYTPQSSSVIGALGSNAAPLYNGNIAAMVMNIPKIGTANVYNYHYDQLNRIVAMDVYNGLTPTAGTFVPVSVSDYQERVSYDPNGNILTYLRNGTVAGGKPLAMDNLGYTYAGSKNQLSHVTDAVSATNYTEDIDNQNSGNYQYDAIGNLISDASENITNITWNVYGKIASINKGGSLISYTYDAAGNRIVKQTPTETTVYVRDAGGNVLSVYSQPSAGSLQQTELHIYGSSRLGMATQHAAPELITLTGGFGNGIKTIFTRGEKLFEGSNHLGNVLVTVSDKKISVDANADGIVDYYTADVISAQDYAPFGSLLSGRQYGTKGRYLFNGKEQDKEVKGEGAQYDYGFRIYDPRIGRFLSRDPLAKSFPWYSPYQFAGNTPIAAIDLDGEEQKIMINWYDVNGNITGTKIIKQDFDNVNKLYQSLSQGLNKETTYTLEGTKFNANNAQFTTGFEAYKKGTANPRNPNAPHIRPNNGLLKFDIATDAKGNQSVKISFDNAPINEKELFADALHGSSKVTNVVGTAVEGAGYVVSVIPGGQAVGVPLIGIGKGVALVGDGADIGADLLEGKKGDALIKGGVALVGVATGKAIDKIPIQKVGKEAIDTYVGRGAGAIKDGYFDNRTQKVEEADKLDLKIETKKN